MKTIVHLSDLHFGRQDARLLDPLRERVASLAPDLLVVSGDLTQRATKEQFRQAKAFLDSLPYPKLIAPGNHDAPLSPLERFPRPLARFQELIEPSLSPVFKDDELAALGVCSVRPLSVKNGGVSASRIKKLQEALIALPEGLTRVVVTHHPFDAREGLIHGPLIGGAREAMRAFAAGGVDILLSGHTHRAAAMLSSERYPMPNGYQAVIVSAGTAISTRGRGEANSFNALRVERDQIEAQAQRWSDRSKSFEGGDWISFERQGLGWRRVSAQSEGARERVDYGAGV